MYAVDTIKVKMTKPYREIWWDSFPEEISVEDFFSEFGIDNIIRAKMLEKKHYNEDDNTYWPFNWADEAINFLKRYN